MVTEELPQDAVSRRIETQHLAHRGRAPGEQRWPDGIRR
jgi:hypothetical protein